MGPPNVEHCIEQAGNWADWKSLKQNLVLKTKVLLHPAHVLRKVCRVNWSRAFEQPHHQLWRLSHRKFCYSWTWLDSVHNSILLPVMCSQLHLLLGFTMLSSTLRKDVFRNCTSCFNASFRHSRDKRQIIRFIPAVNLSMVELCCLIPAHVLTASPSPISATTADVVLGKSTS